MKIDNLRLWNFKSFDEIELSLNGKSTVIFGVNGTGKTSLLNSICLLYANIINKIVNRTELKQNYKLVLDDIKFGKSQAKIEADFIIENEIVDYCRTITRNTGRRGHNLDNLKIITDAFQIKYIDDVNQDDIPIFVNYGTNRLVLDIPIRIKMGHIFDIYSAFDKAIENKIDFKSFFEWYRMQEDYENECKIRYNDFDYSDKALEAVKRAMLMMLDDCSDLRVVRKPRLMMKVEKNGINLNISQLSDGEKCTMALFGDLARRLVIANPNLDNPLLGEGVVLIDEIELHMHPSWQRSILSKLRETFPNIQFIVTTHSPIVLGEVNDEYNVFFVSCANGSSIIEEYNRLDGFDTNYILEEFMGTKSLNYNTQELIDTIYRLIYERKYDEAEKRVKELISITDSVNKDVLRANIMIKKGRMNDIY